MYMRMCVVIEHAPVVVDEAELGERGVCDVIVVARVVARHHHRAF